MKSSPFIRLFAILILGTLLISTRTFALSDLHLVFDLSEAEAKIAKKFRLDEELHASASGQFTADELPRILHAIPAERRQDIWIIDLRQESHGFIDGLPVSWVTDRNCSNLNKTPAQIEKEEKKLLQAVSKQKTVTVYVLKKLQDGQVSTGTPTTMLPELVETEQELVTSFDAQYARIYALDHNKPSDAEVDTFVNFIKYQITDRDWLHFHCRGGGGRSSTFIAMYDMIRNAENVALPDIMQRQASMGNKKLDEMPTIARKIWKTEAAQERYDFLAKFYAYVRDPQGYRVRSWSDWLQRDGV